MLDNTSPAVDKSVAELIAALRACTPQQQPWVRDMLIRELRLLLPKDKYSTIASLSYASLCALIMGMAGTTMWAAVPATLLAALVSSRIANDEQVRVLCCAAGTKVGEGAARACNWVSGLFSRKAQ